MATCATQAQPRICVAGSLWGVCDELVFPDGLIVEINLIAPNGAFLVDAAGQCSDISLADYVRLEVVADQDGCWRTCDLAGNIGTGDNFIQPGNTRYFIRVLNGSDNQVLYQSAEFIIDADQIGTYPVDVNGCVQLCVLSPPATSTPTNPFCDAVQACETPWVGVNGPLISITPGDNPAGLVGNGHQPTIGVDTTALCNFVQASCIPPFNPTDAFGIVWTVGGTQDHDVTATFTPSADVGQAIQVGTDSQPLVLNSSLTLTGPTQLTFTDNLGVPNIVSLAGVGNTSIVTPNLAAGTWQHDDGAGTLQTIASTGVAAGNDLAVDATNGGSFLDLVAGTGVTLTPGAPGVLTISASGNTSVVTPNLALGSWVHDDGQANLNDIRSTSADANNDIGIGSDGGSFLDLQAGAGIVLTPGVGGVLTVAAAGGGIDRQTHQFAYDAYTDTPPGISPGFQHFVGTSIRWGVAATTAPNANETWNVLVNGGVVGVVTLAAAATTGVGTIAAAVPLDAVVTIAPVAVTPGVPSTYGSVVLEIT